MASLWKSWITIGIRIVAWSNNYKDFLFIAMMAKVTTLGMASQRIKLDECHREILLQKFTQIKPEFGAASYYYQFSNFNAFQLKQVWYRVKELSLWGQEKLKEINSTYSITMLDKSKNGKMP